MFKISEFGCPRDINDVVPEVIYYYLVEGVSLQGIEERIFNRSDCKGWISKTILNYYGIDTSKESKNCGHYEGVPVEQVVADLRSSTELYHSIVAKILAQKYL